VNKIFIIAIVAGMLSAVSVWVWGTRERHTISSHRLQQEESAMDNSLARYTNLSGTIGYSSNRQNLLPTPLSNTEELRLLALFEATTDDSEKSSLVPKIVRIGGDKSAEAFVATLLADRGARPLDQSGLRLIDSTIRGLGHLSSTSKLAEDFLVNGMAPSHWSQIRTWRMSNESAEKWEDQSLAGRCLVALSYSRSPHAYDFIAKRNDLASGEVVGWSEYIVDATFHLELVERIGRDAVLDLHAEDLLAEFDRWKSSGSGKDIYNWYRKLNNIP